MLHHRWQTITASAAGWHPLFSPTCEEVLVVVAIAIAVQVGGVLPRLTIRQVVLLELVWHPASAAGYQR